MAKRGLYANINARKRKGISRPKSKSTITAKATCILSVKSPLVTLHDIGMVSGAYLIQTQTCIPFFLALVSDHLKRLMFLV